MNVPTPFSGEGTYYLRQLPYSGTPQEAVRFDVLQEKPKPVDGAIIAEFNGASQRFLNVLHGLERWLSQATVPSTDASQIEDMVTRQLDYLKNISLLSERRQL